MVAPILAEMERSAYGCFTLEFGGQEHSGGTIVVEWLINPRGDVASATIVESDIDNEDFAKCVVDAAHKLEFPAAQRGTALRKPYEFRRAGPAATSATL
ncbi:MAG: AgmX/PglI C-terminal domain-containing protein [Polyangiaceae bacterium]|nr:AgmX/PglI C-terminal domain-containing protein [Polyangiaceae bacterium]